MSYDREPIRSYQRIFRPERRIYHLEGRALPVPGGVPLRWLGYATAALVSVLALSTGSTTIALLLAGAGALSGLAIGGRSGAAVASIGAFALAWLLGQVLGLLDWPLRLIVVPVGVATFATQATPDGRHADRFALSWLALRVAPRRRSLERALPPLGGARVRGGSLWVAPDQHSPEIRRARIHGPGVVSFASSTRVRRVGLRQRRLLARPATTRTRRGDLIAERLTIGEGESLEVRP